MHEYRRESRIINLVRVLDMKEKEQRKKTSCMDSLLIKMRNDENTSRVPLYTPLSQP